MKKKILLLALVGLVFSSSVIFLMDRPGPAGQKEEVGDIIDAEIARIDEDIARIQREKPELLEDEPEDVEGEFVDEPLDVRDMPPELWREIFGFSSSRKTVSKTIKALQLNWYREEYGTAIATFDSKVFEEDSRAEFLRRIEFLKQFANVELCFGYKINDDGEIVKDSVENLLLAKDVKYAIDSLGKKIIGIRSYSTTQKTGHGIIANIHKTSAEKIFIESCDVGRGRGVIFYGDIYEFPKTLKDITFMGCGFSRRFLQILPASLEKIIIEQCKFRVIKGDKLSVPDIEDNFVDLGNLVNLEHLEFDCMARGNIPRIIGFEGFTKLRFFKAPFNHMMGAGSFGDFVKRVFELERKLDHLLEISIAMSDSSFPLEPFKKVVKNNLAFYKSLLNKTEERPNVIFVYERGLPFLTIKELMKLSKEDLSGLVFEIERDYEHVLKKI